MTQPLIFVSYSNQDEKEKAALLTQLKGLERAGHLTVWSADSVDPGTDTGAARAKAMTGLPFIETVLWGLAYHDLTREGLLKRYIETQPDMLATAARLAAPIYEARGDDITIAIEALYCHIVAGAAKAATELLDSLLLRAGIGRDWKRVGTILKAQDEAEALPFSRPLARTTLHWIARGLTRSDQGDLEGAIADYDKAIELNPEEATAYYNRGNTRRKQGDVDGAVSDLETARQLRPDHLSTLVNLAGAYVEAGKTREGEQLAEELLSQLPETDYYNRACLNALIGHDEAALDLLEKSLAENPSRKEWAQQDPDWRRLRGHPRYRELVGLPPLDE